MLVQRVPNYANLTVPNGTQLTGSAYSGSTGGVLAIRVAGRANIDGTINMSERGFSGGAAVTVPVLKRTRVDGRPVAVTADMVAARASVAVVETLQVVRMAPVVAVEAAAPVGATLAVVHVVAAAAAAVVTPETMAAAVATDLSGGNGNRGGGGCHAGGGGGGGASIPSFLIQRRLMVLDGSWAAGLLLAHKAVFAVVTVLAVTVVTRTVVQVADAVAASSI